MRIRPLLLIAPVVMAGSMLLVSPTAVRAANGLTETGTTTYEVVPGKNVIQVTIQISIYNGKPDTTTSSGTTYYYWNATQITVEQEAGSVSATSDAGGVSQSTYKTDQYYRYVKLVYPNVYYGQTRVVTATYTIPAAPHAAGGYRAGLAYASLCAVGNGWDTGTLSVVLPTGFELYVDGGGDLTRTDTTGGEQVFSSGIQTNPDEFWTCIDAEDPASLTHTPLTAGGQAFDIEGWPEDASWSSTIRDDVGADVQGLEDLTGLKMPGGTVTILEAGDQQLGDFAGLYDSATSTASIPETILKDTVAHELAHIWFNRSMLQDKWMSEGLAGYSERAAGEGNYTPCKEPGLYPGSGSPDLMTWQLLTNDSTTQQQDILDWQYAASCYAFTSLAGSMGSANFKNVLEATAADEMAYIGSMPDEKQAGGSLPLSSKQMLDLIDERGMVPAGITDLDEAQNLLARYGIFDSTTLAARSSARAAYHSLAAAAGGWKLPYAIRSPMSNWEFDSAEAAIATARQIIDVRDAIQKKLSGFSLDGTDLQKQFEAAGSQADLANLLVLIKKESDAADKLDQATRLRDGRHSVLQAIGLLGTDLNTPLKQARTDLQGVKPDQASTEAQSVIDRVNGSSDQGLLRGGAVAGILAVLLLVIAFIVFIRRRRPAVVVVVPYGGQTGPVVMLPPGPVDPAANPWWTPGDAGGLSAQAWGQPPVAPTAAQWPPAGSWQPPVAEWPPAPDWPPAGEWQPPDPTPAANPEAETDRNVEPPTG